MEGPNSCPTLDEREREEEETDVVNIRKFKYNTYNAQCDG